MIKGVIIGGDRLKEKLDKVYPAAQAEILASMQRIVIALTRKIKAEKLSGQVLKNVTGTLRRSITPSVNASGAGIVLGRVGTNVEYAAIHEFGGKTPPHVIEPKKAQALAFFMGGKQVFAKRVNHPGSVIPERSFMRTALEEMRPEIREEFQNALTRVIQL